MTVFVFICQYILKIFEFWVIFNVAFSDYMYCIFIFTDTNGNGCTNIIAVRQYRRFRGRSQSSWEIKFLVVYIFVHFDIMLPKQKLVLNIIKLLNQKHHKQQFFQY
jgi:hypothetical protein